MEKPEGPRRCCGSALTDVVSLVRICAASGPEPCPTRSACRRYANRLAQQANGRSFTEEERRWLGMMKDRIATSLELEVEDF